MSNKISLIVINFYNLYKLNQDKIKNKIQLILYNN